MDLKKISNILGADTVKKIYEDAASKPVQEGSKIATDLVKALIWQAIRNGYTLISSDEQVNKYRSEGLHVLGR
jgi:hypothetical protein